MSRDSVFPSASKRLSFVTTNSSWGGSDELWSRTAAYLAKRDCCEKHQDASTSDPARHFAEREPIQALIGVRQPVEELLSNPSKARLIGANGRRRAELLISMARFVRGRIAI
jgi:hypothetical protein